ncbi:MAG: sugar ABC transporter ATP-binding protein [Spirochaetes bacterium]|nr:sugar ABC transporter ATP-binding protein [Spirochaetota bacterium]
MKLEMRGIQKSFGPVVVLKDMRLEVDEAEIHALVGENGAGKSTLMKILGGVIPRDSGEILVDGRPVEIMKVRDAERCGIAIIHQELSILPDMSVADNIFLGSMPRTRFGLVDEVEMRRIAAETLARLGLEVDPRVKAGSLGIGQLQLVEIAKALIKKARLIVMDEPTSALSDREIERLFEVMRSLKVAGVSFVYISHRLEELFAVCDNLSVIRDGEYIATAPVAELSFGRVVAMMVGREIGDRFPPKTNKPGTVVLETRGLGRAKAFREVSFSLRGGEVLGVAGLMGAGRTELVRALFGAEPADEGQILIDGSPTKIDSPREAMRKGLALVTEDRKLEGLFLGFGVDFNIGAANFPALGSAGIVVPGRLTSYAERLVETLHVKTPAISAPASSLSGGNQQKVVLAKWLGREPRILVLDEPTRGVDVGAKREIYEIIDRLAARGVAVLMVSSELPEIIGMSDRVLVMRSGKAAGLLESDITQEKIMSLATGVSSS